MQNASKQTAGRFTKYLIVSRLWAPFAIMATVVILSGSAGVQTGGLSFIGMDKLGHLVVFGLLGIALLRTFKDPSRRGLLLVAVCTALATGFGLVDEFRQYYNPMRTFEWADLLADFVGALIASSLYARWKGFRRLLEIEISAFLRLRSPLKP